MTPSWINNSFVERAIRNGDDDPDAEVESIYMKPALSVGENYCSDLFRIKVQLRGKSEMRSIMVKIPPKGNEKLVEDLGAFLTESKVFSELLPKMYSISKQLNVNIPAFSPQFLFSGNEPDAFVVLEDLSVLGYRNTPRQKGLDLEHCKLVLQYLGRFHALSLALYTEDPHAFDDFHVGPHARRKRDDDITKKFWASTTKSFVNELRNWPLSYEKYGEKILKVADKMGSAMKNKTRFKEGAFNVFNHGDLWSNNIMFEYSEGKPVSLRFVDFQMCYFASPAVDLQYFLHSSPTETVRLRYSDYLISEYHKTLIETLNLLGCSQFHITLDELKQDIDRHYFYAFFTVLVVLPIVVAVPSTGQDIRDSLSKVVNEGDSFSSSMYKNRYYMEYMLKLLPIFERKGFFDV